MLDKLINTALLKTFGENTIVPLKGAVESVVKDLAPEEKSPSVKAHAVGELIMYGSVLYKVINAVAVGDVLDPGNNIELTTVSEELKNGGSGIVVDDEMSNVSENPVQNKIITSALSGKVDKVAGKVLSSNDFTDEYKNKTDNASQYVDLNTTEFKEYLSTTTPGFLKSNPASSISENNIKFGTYGNNIQLIISNMTSNFNIKANSGIYMYINLDADILKNTFNVDPSTIMISCFIDNQHTSLVATGFGIRYIENQICMIEGTILNLTANDVTAQNGEFILHFLAFK